MILAIETSCDDSAVALLDLGGKPLFSKLASQVKLHEKYGGVVPELASRKHLTSLPLLLTEALGHPAFSPEKLTGIAVTYAPGLIGSVLVGLSAAKVLAWRFQVPLWAVDHLEGHLLAPFLDNPSLTFPYLALIASGGHTHLIVAEEVGQYRLLGKTMDDAAGEAYDKVAKMLGFVYPGGPIVDKIAEAHDEVSVQFPIPLKGKPTLDFSFSGLKTAVRNEATKLDLLVKNAPLMTFEAFQESELSQDRRLLGVVKSFQEVMIQIVTERFKKALKITGPMPLALTGGVACNRGLRRGMTEFAARRNLDFFVPEPKHCTDNAAMIGLVACLRAKKGEKGIDDYFRLNAASKSPLSLMETER